MVRGKLLIFEGIDGAGKTTHANILRDTLTQLDYDVVYTKEPTADSEPGRMLRDSAVTGRLQAYEELNCFAEDRYQHVTNKILPAIKEGKIVICDRYIPSSLVYQGSRGIPYNVILAANAHMPTPDLTLLFDVHARVAMSRINKSREKPSTFENLNALRNYRDIYNKLTAGEIGLNMGQTVQINTLFPKEDVAAQVLAFALNIIGE